MSHLRSLDEASAGTSFKGIRAITGGGLGTNSKAAAGAALNAVALASLNAVNGIAGLDNEGKLRGDQIPFDDVASVSLAGPVSVARFSSAQYFITNFDSYTTYDVEALAGTVSIDGDVITYYAPAESGPAGFIVNGRQIDIEVIGLVPDAPSLTISQAVGGDNRIDVTILGSAFSVPGNGTLHASTDWQISLNSNFTNVIESSMNDTVNKLGITFESLTPNTPIWIRARYRDTDGAASVYTVEARTTMGAAPGVTLNSAVDVYAGTDMGQPIGTFTGPATGVSISPGGPKYTVQLINNDIVLRTVYPTLADDGTTLTVTVTDNGANTVRTIVLNTLELAINPTVFQSVSVNQGYSQSGGVFFTNNDLGSVYPAPIQDFQVVSGALPGGSTPRATSATDTSFFIGSIAELFGAPGVYNVRLRAIYDSRYSTAAPHEFDLEITVNPISFAVETQDWTFPVNQSVSTFTPRKWIARSQDSGIVSTTVHSGTFPPGMSKSDNQGGNRDVIVSGTPNTPGVYTFTLMCSSPYQGGESPKESGTITITITP